MKFFSSLTKAFLPAGSIRQMVGVREISNAATAINDVALRLVGGKEPKNPTTFADAVARLQLTEAEIDEKAQSLFRMAMFFLAFAVGMFAYAMYLFWQSSPHGAFAATGISLVIFAMAFRYHFWFFQVKHRKLGCTFKEWWNSSVDGSKQQIVTTKNTD